MTFVEHFRRLKYTSPRRSSSLQGGEYRRPVAVNWPTRRYSYTEPHNQDRRVRAGYECAVQGKPGHLPSPQSDIQRCAR